MRVIVTGGSGRVGGVVVRELAALGHQVWNVDKLPRPELPAQGIQADLTDAGQVYDAFAQVRPDGVCHLAANPAPGGYANVALFQNNVLSAFHVMQAAGDLGVRQVVYASSEMATGWLTPRDALPPRLPFEETDQQPSANVYALSKFTGEVVMDSMALRFPEIGWVSLRLNNVVLPDDYATLAWRREDPRRGMGNFWGYVDARDAASAFAVALVGGLPGHEVFHVAAADTSSDKPLAELLGECYPGYTGLDRDHPPFASACSCAKVTRMLGWEPLHSWREQT